MGREHAVTFVPAQSSNAALALIRGENSVDMGLTVPNRTPETDDPAASNAQGDRLDSWKAIAAYLGRDGGTVRRWERTRGLPVHRVPGGKGSSVFAYTGEIDAWLRSAPKETDAPTVERPVRRHRLAGG
jgi:hypothetical protein